MKNKKILVTGAAGFIGYHLAKKLLNLDYEVIGLDIINEYYDVRVKYGRLSETGISKSDIKYGEIVNSNKYPNYRFIQLKLEDKIGLEKLFRTEQNSSTCKIQSVCNLAAQAGVRYSLTNPQAYIDSNIVGFMNILEVCRHYQVEHLSYASSSSVYGLNETMPFSTKHNVDHPISLYAASKKSNELMAHTYSHLFGLPTTGLRFFTVYGPWGRPDMALFLFTKAMLEGRPIEVFNNGQMKRDFTYIDDIVEGLYRVIETIPKGDLRWSGTKPDPSGSRSPYKIYNIGNSQPVLLMDFIKAVENELGIEAKKIFKPIQAGDVPATWADTSDLEKDLGYKPNTLIDHGVKQFVRWYLDFFGDARQQRE